ncbi:MAG: tripartite tricarboxylate transporter permease [Gracilibacteraceae bacterium]|nr:tripartite tricarboxylate transporter permease [Gracilibacteraceae bacterium]
MDIFSYLAAALSPAHLLLMLFGMVFGIVIGAMPGLTPTLGVALLIPMTFRLSAEAGLIVLGAVYIGAVYGGHITAVLIGIPGAPAAIATTFDGFPMNKNGFGQRALNIGVTSSFIGGLLGVCSLILFAPALAHLTLAFGPAENFWVALFGIAVIASLAIDNFWKGIVSGMLGLLLSFVGTSAMTGIARFTFGQSSLIGGISVVPALIGMFSIPQVISLFCNPSTHIISDVNKYQEENHPLRDALYVIKKPFALGLASVIGVVIGIPGAGGQVGGIVAYDWVKRTSKDKEQFGGGFPDGVIASQSSANATVGGALVPLLTLGIPGSATAAVLLGGLLIHGLFPGANLFTAHADVTYTFIWSLFLAHLVLLPLGFMGARVFSNINSLKF